MSREIVTFVYNSRKFFTPALKALSMKPFQTNLRGRNGKVQDQYLPSDLLVIAVIFSKN